MDLQYYLIPILLSSNFTMNIGTMLIFTVVAVQYIMGTMGITFRDGIEYMKLMSSKENSYRIEFDDTNFSKEAVAVIDHIIKNSKSGLKKVLSIYLDSNDFTCGDNERIVPVKSISNIGNLQFSVSNKEIELQSRERWKPSPKYHDKYIIDVSSETLTCKEIIETVKIITTDYFLQRGDEDRCLLYFLRYLGIPISGAGPCGNCGVRSINERPKRNFTRPVIFKDLNNVSKFPLNNFDSLFFESKDEIIKNIKRFQNKEWYVKHNQQRSMGMLFHGPSGTGKSKTITSIANYLNRNIIEVPFSLLNGSRELIEVMDTFLESKEKISINLSNSIIVFDEFDKNYSKNIEDNTCAISDMLSESSCDSDAKGDRQIESHSNRSYGQKIKDNNKVSKKIDLGILLSLIDGIINSDGIFIIATVNNLDSVNPLIYRDGRLTPYEFELPSKANFIRIVEKYYEIELSKLQKHTLTDGKLSGSSIHRMCMKYDTIDEFIENLNNV